MLYNSADKVEYKGHKIIKDNYGGMFNCKS